MLADNPDANTLLLCQDDMVYCSGIKAFLERDLWPAEDCGLVSLYACAWKGYELGMSQAGCKRISGGALMGACAMVYPRHAAEGIVEYADTHGWRGCFAKDKVQEDPAKKTALDAFLGYAVRGCGLYAYYYLPSMSQHIGHHSTVGHGVAVGKRRSKLFPGEHVDAGTIYPRVFARFNRSDGSQGVVTELQEAAKVPVTVIIPGKGLPRLTVKCVRSVMQQAVDRDVRIVYVDNGSSLEDLDIINMALSESDQAHTIIRNPTNLGFSKAINQGLEQKDDGHVLLLNNDAAMAPGCLAELIKVVESKPHAGAASPIMGDHGPMSIHRDPRLRDAKETGSVLEMKRLSFSCCLIHQFAARMTKSIRSDGPLKSGLAADDMWCFQVRKAGYRLYLCGAAFCEHVHAATFKAEGIPRAQIQREAVEYVNNG